MLDILLRFPLILLENHRRHYGYGNVQRGILGVQGELNSNASKELGLKQTEGFILVP
jgi:S1-C subfamily serine protease